MKKRNILITNDDGITSDGIVRLAQAATKFGEVWVVAPKHQCSAMSHRITLHEPMDLEKVDFPASITDTIAVRMCNIPQPSAQL